MHVITHFSPLITSLKSSQFKYLTENIRKILRTRIKHKEKQVLQCTALFTKKLIFKSEMLSALKNSQKNISVHEKTHFSDNGIITKQFILFHNHSELQKIASCKLNTEQKNETLYYTKSLIIRQTPTKRLWCLRTKKLIFTDDGGSPLELHQVMR